MATNAEIRDVIASACRSIDGLNVYLYPQDNISAPAVMVAGFTMVTTTYAGNRQTTADVIVAVSKRNVDQLAHLDELLEPSGPMSITAAIDGATTDTISLFVSRIGDYSDYVIADVAHYGAVITVEVQS